jgi:hypothetical protein
VLEEERRPTALPLTIEGALRRVSASHRLVVIAGQWPSWLVSLVALDLPIQAAYFPLEHHRYFKPKNPVTSWMPPLTLFHGSVDVDAIYLVSGTVKFVRKLRPWFTGLSSQRLIVSLESHLRGASRSMRLNAKKEGLKLLREMHLRSVFFTDRDCGGATDAVHYFGFGSDIESAVLPRPEVGLPLCVRHYLDGGADFSALQFKYMSRTSVPGIVDPSRAVLWHEGILRPDGLLPSHNPNVTTYCPVHEAPRSWVVRALTLVELLRLYQLPLSMDPLFERHISLTSGLLRRATERALVLVQEVILPFENSPSSAILTSIIRKLWSVDGGGSVTAGLG